MSGKRRFLFCGWYNGCGADMGYAMARQAGLVAGILAACLLARGAAGEDPLAKLPQLKRDLASTEFAVREGAQKELEKIPADQVEALRSAAKSETDPEVKARLDERVQAMEMHNLLHPAPLTVKVKDAPLADVGAELNRQLGAQLVQTRGAAAVKLTLDMEKKGFGEIVAEMARQQMLTVSSLTSATGSQVVLQPTAAKLRIDAMESFALLTQAAGSPATGNWSLRVVVAGDPRIRAAQYSSVLQIEKMTDQDGRNLLPILLPTGSSMVMVARPTSVFSSQATPAPAPGVTRIRELRAKVPFMLMVSEKKMTFDLKQLPEKPIETSRGAMSFERGNSLMLRFDGAPATAARTPVTVMVTQPGGAMTTVSTTTGTQVNLTAVARLVENGGAITVSWPDELRECAVPVELKDIELPGLER
jgi:hypothetical protein